MVLKNDIIYGLRMLVKSPGFTFATVLILALGIGGVTAMFSMLHTVLIHPLPYSEPDHLVMGRCTIGGKLNPWVSALDYTDYRDRSRSFASLEAFRSFTREVTITSDNGAERANEIAVSVGLFPTLGVKMFKGRPFAAEEGLTDAPPVAVVSYSYWQEHLTAQTDVVGRSIVIDGVSHIIVGVTSPDFRFIYEADVWRPMRPNVGFFGPRFYYNWFVLGRLKNGVTLAEAQSDMDVISAQLEQAYPDYNTNRSLLLTPLQGAFTEKYRPSFAMLCGGAGAILLIACANAAGLLLARGAGRHGELAVRAAMGASRWRLMRPLLTEAIILAGIAGVAGTFLAVQIQGILLRWMPIESLLLSPTGLSGSVLLFVLLITILTGLGFGILPALYTRHVNVSQDLRSIGRGTLHHGMRLRGALVVGQVTLSFVLLVVAGLLIRSITGLNKADPGFDSRNLLTAEIPLPPTYDTNESPAFFTSLLDNVKALPGVVAAAAISQLPIRNPFNDIAIRPADTAETDPMVGSSGNQRAVLPGYFEAMGIPLLAGRDIRPTDTHNSGRVVVISKILAQILFPDRDPLGQQVIMDRGNTVTWQVVGIVDDVKENNLYEQTNSRGTFYRSYYQLTPRTMELAIRTEGNPMTIVAPLRSLLHKMDPKIPLSGPRTMEDIMANTTVSEKAQAVYLTTFSLLALTLAAIGIYALLAYVVTQRRRDIGVRMALGAKPFTILSNVLGSGMKLVVIGLALGLLGAIALTHILHGLFFGVASIDVMTFGTVMVLLGVIASIACVIPAWRASKIDPMEALRYE